MKISELTTGQGNVDVEGNLSEVGEPKVFTKFGRELKVSNAILKDDSGSIKLTLWNEDVSKFNEGDTVKITNGYVNEFQGEPQLTAGKFGKMEKVGEGEVSESDEPEAGKASLSDETAETMAEDASEDAAVEEAVKEEAPEGTPEEQVEEASEELEEASEEPEEQKKEKSEESEKASEEPEEKSEEEAEKEESQEDF